MCTPVCMLLIHIYRTEELPARVPAVADAHQLATAVCEQRGDLEWRRCATPQPEVGPPVRQGRGSALQHRAAAVHQRERRGHAAAAAQRSLATASATPPPASRHVGSLYLCRPLRARRSDTARLPPCLGPGPATAPRRAALQVAGLSRSAQRGSLRGQRAAQASERGAGSRRARRPGGGGRLASTARPPPRRRARVSLF